MKVLVFLSVLLVGSLCVSVQEQLLRDLYSQWKLTHNKLYRAGFEDELRFNIFAQNYISILKFNKEQSDVTLGLNQFADLTSEEFGNMYTGLKPQARNSNRAAPLTGYFYRDLPESVDWREKGAVAPVKNQGQCGSCWAFSAIGAMETLYFIDHGELVLLSEQNFVDCVRDGCEGCNGGWMDTAFEYSARNGVLTGDDYPYKAKDQVCQYDASKAVKVNTWYYDVPENSAVALKTAITKNTVSVAIQADQLVFQFYITGVIKSGCGASLNHGVLAVGYDNFNGVEAYIVKNSWGTIWGNKGYVLISTDETQNQGRGVCGILMASSYPTNN